MLTITPAASEAITALLDPPAVPEGSGLRLIRGPTQPDGAAIGLSIAEQPGPQDQVLDAGGGADLFLDPETADLLDDKELDAQLEGDRVILQLPAAVDWRRRMVTRLTNRKQPMRLLAGR